MTSVEALTSSVDELPSSLDKLDVISNGIILTNNNNEVIEKPKTQLDLITDELRSQFLQHASDSPSEYDPLDIERIRNDDLWLQRFLLVNKNKPKPALKQLTEAMKWRKSFGARQKSWSDVSVEMFSSGFVSIDTKPIIKNQPIIVYIAFLADHPWAKNKSGLDFLILQFYTILDLIDRQVGDCGLIALVDFTESELPWPTVSEIKFLFSKRHLINYYPLLIKKILLFNLPWYLKPLVKIVNALFPTEIYSVSGQQVFDHIDKDYVPKFIGGESDKELNQPPSGCWKSIDDIGKECGLGEDEIWYFKRKIEYIAKKLEVMVEMAEEKEKEEKEKEEDEFQINVKKSRCLE